MEATSVLVPSVQDLAKQPLTRLPERYVLLDQDSPIISNTTSLPQVPVIDLSKLLSQDEGPQELDKMHYACKEWGFFQLLNHGVHTSLVENVKTGIKELFDLPPEEKKKLWQREGDIEGFGQVFVLSDEQKLEWADAFSITTLPSHKRKPHIFPNIPQPLRDNLDNYSANLEKLANKILDFMARALTMDPKEMRELFNEGSQVMKASYYPPCPQPELAVGLNTHSDGCALTILLQINDVEGLQIIKDGLWIPVQPLPNAFIVNIGDTLEVITNGIYQSNEHRAVVNSEKERMSIATFYGPSFESIIAPAPSLVTPERPALFRRISVPEFLTGYLSRELRGKSYRDHMRIQNEINGKSS